MDSNTNSPTVKLVGATAGIDWDKLSRDVTYQLYTGDRWINVSRAIYATIKHPQNRRILLRDEQRAINDDLIKI